MSDTVMKNRGGWVPPADWAKKPKQLVIVGTGNNAEVAYEFFTHDSPYDVAAFSVEAEYLKEKTKWGLPVVPFETVQKEFEPANFSMFVAIGYAKLNHLRARFYREAKEKGYELASYVNSNSCLWRDVEIGENCFILEDTVVQPFVRIGNNVTLWSGTHVAHGSVIKDHVYMATHIALAGFVEVGEYCFLGMNVTVGNEVRIGENCLIGAGALVTSDTEPNQVYSPRKTASRRFEDLSPSAKEMFSPG